MLKKGLIAGLVTMAGIFFSLSLNNASAAAPPSRHGDINAKWSAGPHARTQSDVAGELSDERAGQTPGDVIHGNDPEDCIACHGPTSVLANGGMTEEEALQYFFTTKDGRFTKDTTAAHTDEWPNVSCSTCHYTLAGQSAAMPALALFNSQTGKYVHIKMPAKLCGQCHGTLHIADTDHRTYNGWSMSRHNHTQSDVAGELSDERVGQTPGDVIHGDDPEDCIACHGPTSVLANGGMTEAKALQYFFTTKDGRFTKDTTVAHTDEWPGVSCVACHDPHNPAVRSYFNSSTGKYVIMKNTADLCGQCHGNLRFPDTDHLSYNILSGKGGIGVPVRQTMPGVTCTDCHMYNSGVDGSNSAMFHGHKLSITVKDANGKSSTSCTKCHETIDGATAKTTIGAWKSSFQALDATTGKNVAAAGKAITGLNDKGLKAKLEEAQNNLRYAESDESGGFHNHRFLMSLLQDANGKALEVLSSSKQ
ncbi:MAG: ammonia-forming cytochrome c nitrite reductase subunit c552 [Deltaproteobacteria bacterium]|nr:ammonia-forming cytochrome c nitrite reductase subunit c552 [Deltaproteobacteria bacterium]